MRKFKVGDIVQDGTYVSSIKKIEGNYAYLSENSKYGVELEKLAPVKIGSGHDNFIILDCNIPLRAPIVAMGTSVPIRVPKPYFENSINGKVPIASIVTTNRFEFVHELQDWLSEHAPDYTLKMRF